MGTVTSMPGASPERWHRANNTPVGNALLVPALVLLAIVIGIELMSLVLVIQGHVAQAEIRERIRAATPVTTTVAARL